MSVEATVQGNLGNQPELKTTKTGKPMISLSIAATLRTRDKQTGEWADDGDPLWVRATFFDWAADQIQMMNLQKGAKVAVKGPLVQRSFTGQDGQARQSLEIKYPVFLGVTPRTQGTQNGYQAAPYATNSAAPVSTTGPTGNGTQTDPWAAPGQANFDDEPPF